VSFLDKHTPLTSGQAALNLILNLRPTTKKTTLMQQMNCHAVQDIKIEFFEIQFYNTLKVYSQN